MANGLDIDLEKYHLKILDYGESGTGKTCFLKTFPKPIVADFDNGSLVYAGMDVEYEKFDRSDPNELKRYESWMIKDVIPKLKNGERQTFGFDSITTFADLVMQATLQANGRLGQNPQLQDWMTQMNVMQSTFNKLLGFPCNVVIIAHEQLEKDDLTGALRGTPMITGKMAGKLSLYFDEVYRSVLKGGSLVKDGEYWLQTKASQGFTAKSRLDSVLKAKGLEGIPSLLTPDYSAIMALINGKEVVKEKPKAASTTVVTLPKRT